MHTPNPNTDNGELRNVTRPASCWSEKRSDQKTKYKERTVIKMAWMLEIPLPKLFPKVNNRKFYDNYKCINVKQLESENILTDCSTRFVGFL